MSTEQKRPYAARLPEPHTRRCQVAFCISSRAKQALCAHAAARRMSVSEYMARLLADHLRFVEAREHA
jgi:hypothetical protein